MFTRAGIFYDEDTMTPGKLRALIKDLWQNSPVSFVLADGTPLRVTTHQVQQTTGLDEDGNTKLVGPPELVVWLEPVGSADIPPPAQTVPMGMDGWLAIDELPGTGD